MARLRPLPLPLVRPLILVVASACGGTRLVVGCGEDDPAPAAQPAATADGGDGVGGEDASVSNDGGADAGGGSTGSLIPTDGGPYLVATVDGTPLSFGFNLAAARGATGAFATIRGAVGLTLPLRDLEVRLPNAVGPATCDGTVLSVASAVLRTNDLGTLESRGDGAGCSFDVTATSTGSGERVKGTFSAVVRTTTGPTVHITDGAFDVPTAN